SINGDVLRQIFAGLTFLIAIYMAAGVDKTAEQIARLPAFLSARVQKELCVLIGVVSAMIGVGGAILTVPLMTYTGLPIRRAVGTGALLGVVVAFPAMLVYMISGSLQAEALPRGAVGYVNFIAAG